MKKKDMIKRIYYLENNLEKVYSLLKNIGYEIEKKEFISKENEKLIKEMKDIEYIEMNKYKN